MVTGSHKDTLTTGLSDLRTVSTIGQLLAGAIKHHTLYPEHHSIARQHLDKIYQTLCQFLAGHKTLRLEIGKSTMVYDGDVVYQGAPDDNDIAFLLGRDGVEWIEFFRDLELWEVQSLLRTITNNRRSDMDSDGNIATALWEQDFPHIEYKTIDLMAMDLPLLNLASFRVAPEPETVQGGRPGRDAAWQDYSLREAADDPDNKVDRSGEEATTISLAAADTTLWGLTELEQLQLKTAVEREEQGVDTGSTIDLLLILLLTQNDRQEASEILAFLQDRFLHCLQQQQFTHALKILRTLNTIETTASRHQELLRPLIAKLFTTVSRPESLRDLEKFFTSADSSSPAGELNALWALLKLLPPAVLTTLAPLSSTIDIQRFGPPFLAIFEYFCGINPSDLAAVVGDINQKLCLHLFPYIHRIRMDQAIPVLSAMALHPSPLVRSKAFQLLVKWDAVDIKKLLPLMNDPDEKIHRPILALAGRQRDPTIEKMLCSYLQEKVGGSGERDHILACYRALGKSGSAQSIPFLKQCIFHGSSLGTLFAAGGGAHKEGAARALLELRIPEARKLLKEGATSIKPDVRAACRKALGTHNV